MSRPGILTDSTAGIPQYLVDDLRIEIVATRIHRDGETLRDNVDVQAVPFAEYLIALKSDDAQPTTSPPTSDDYVKGFMNLAQHTREIVALTMPAYVSEGYKNCVAAAEIVRSEIPDIKISVIDTERLAMAQGWVAIEAARAAAKNASYFQIVQHARFVAARSFVLHHTPAHPLPSDRVLEWLRNLTRNTRRVHLAFTHCAAESQTEILRDLYFQEQNCIEEMTSPLSPALAVHSGPGTVGICLYAE